MKTLDDVLNAKFLEEYKGIYIEQVSSWQFDLYRKHDFYTLAYIAHNSGTFKIENCFAAEVSEGDIFFITPNTEYRFFDSDHTRSIGLYYCYFTTFGMKTMFNSIERSFPEFESFFTGEVHYLHTHDNNKNEFRDMFVKMIDDFTHRKEGYNHTLKCLLVIFLTDMLRKIKSDENAAPLSTSNEIIDRFLPKLELVLYSKTNVKELAVQEQVSEEYLCWLFKKHMNMTITQYVNSLRVEKIKDLLVNTTRPIDLILNKFTMNPAYIKRVFKKNTGYTIKEYREKYRLR